MRLQMYILISDYQKKTLEKISFCYYFNIRSCISFSERNSFLFLPPVVRQRIPILFRGQRKNVFVNLQGQVCERFDKKSSSHKIERIFCQNLASCQITSFEAALETKSAYSGSLNALKKMSEITGEEIACYELVFGNKIAPPLITALKLVYFIFVLRKFFEKLSF